MSIRKVVAGLLITAGIAIMAVPFFWRTTGERNTNQLINEFEQTLEEKQDERTEVEKEQTTVSKEEKAILKEGSIIGIIEIPGIDIRYPVLEGAGNSQIRYAIGHMTETAGLGEKGNCVLCGHNGSRNGTFFTNLNQLSAGDKVKITDKKGEVHMYEVADTCIIGPYDNTVKNQSDEEILTLLTCANRGTKRFVCRCVPAVKEGEADED
mgnify:CR=1 FL=1